MYNIINIDLAPPICDYLLPSYAVLVMLWYCRPVLWTGMLRWVCNDGWDLLARHAACRFWLIYFIYFYVTYHFYLYSSELCLVTLSISNITSDDIVTNCLLSLNRWFQLESVSVFKSFCPFLEWEGQLLACWLMLVFQHCTTEKRTIRSNHTMFSQKYHWTRLLHLGSLWSGSLGRPHFFAFLTLS